MKPGYAKKTNLLIGGAILIPILLAVAIFISPAIIGSSLFHIAALVLILVGQIMFIAGCGIYAQGKGHHWAWGLLGLFHIIGLLILAVMPDRIVEEGKPKRGVLGSLLRIFAIVLVLLIALPVLLIASVSYFSSRTHDQFENITQNMERYSGSLDSKFESIYLETANTDYEVFEQMVLDEVTNNSESSGNALLMLNVMQKLGKKSIPTLDKLKNVIEEKGDKQSSFDRELLVKIQETRLQIEAQTPPAQ